jgi:hypothetical protein
MSNYTWYIFVDDLSLWMQNNLKDGAKPDWNGELEPKTVAVCILANYARFSSCTEFLNVIAPAKTLLSDRTHNGLYLKEI